MLERAVSAEVRPGRADELGRTTMEESGRDDAITQERAHIAIESSGAIFSHRPATRAA